MSFNSEALSHFPQLKKLPPAARQHVTPNYALSDTEQLKSAYPLGTVLNAFVTNVHNVQQLRFFMFVKNSANAQHFASIRYATTPPTAYKCLRMPREGYVFGLRVGETTVLRAVRIRTMCITTTREVFLPDIGRNLVLEADELEMYHLPSNLRKPPGLAVSCQLRGVNDNVTILPSNMQAFLRGLLYRSVNLRVDGYFGNILKVQLLNVALEQLQQWTAELGPEEHDFGYALKHVILYKPKSMNSNSRLLSDVCSEKHDNRLPPIAEQSSSSDNGQNMNEEIDEKKSHRMEADKKPWNSQSPSSSGSWSSALEITFMSGIKKTLDPQMALSLVSSSTSSVVSEDRFLSAVSTQTSTTDDTVVEQIEASHLKKNLLSREGVTMILPTNPVITCSPKKMCLPPLSDFSAAQVRPILGGIGTPDNSWKRDFLPALAFIDNRNVQLNFSHEELLTITPTYIGQLERFFGVVHRRGECYMQHMWTEDEIPKSSRFTGSRTPYIFDIVLAKHSGDFKWYRAKVIEILKEQCKVRVFFVDYGGVEYVNLWNLADLSRSISKLPFQAVLFRLYDLVDVTTTKAERALGVDFLRTSLLKKTLTVRVINYRNDETTICFDQCLSHVPATLIRKGFMKQSGRVKF